jgi:polysaccharide pyruvyl transferase WcaK-like protein
MRYHGCVLASKNFIPFYTFSYENKMNEVANYSQMKEYVINLNNLDAYSNNNLSNLFESIIFKRDDLSDMLKSRYYNFILPNVEKKTKQLFKGDE